MTAEPRLLVRLGSLGDVVLATAAANALQVESPAPLDVLVKAEWAGIWEGHPAVRTVYRWEGGDRGWAGVSRWAQTLRDQHYRSVIDLQGSHRTRALGLLAGWKNVRRPRRYGWRRRWLVATKRGGPPPSFRVAESFVEAAVPGARALPSVHPSPEATARARELLRGTGAVGVVPGARYATKEWPRERFLDLARKLAAGEGAAIPVFFPPGEESAARDWAADWGDAPGWKPVVADLPTVAACFNQLEVIVANDTGLMHLGAAVGAKMVALFGPTVRSFGFPPVGEGHQVVEVPGLGCRPCHLHGGSRCPRGHFRCMLGIPVERVFSAVAAVRGDGKSRSALTS